MIACHFLDLFLDGWEALPYIWEDSAEPAGIIVMEDRKIKITANLEIALRHLRHDTEIQLF
jgi:hypothetical protein